MYSIADIGKIISCQRLSLQDSEMVIRHLLIDSRKLLFPRHSLFFAFYGKQTDGHLFIDSLYEKGLRSFVVEDPEFDPVPFPEANFLFVDKSLQALQELCGHHRARFNIPVIGLTGSNGKTIIKEWIYSLLGDDINIVRSPGSYNSQIGVPLSLWQMDGESELALIEAGISKKGEMEALGKIVKPEIGIFTNLGDAHNSGFKDKEEKLEEKLKLFRSSNTLIFHQDEDLVSTRIHQLFSDRQLISWSETDESVPFYIHRIEIIKSNSTIHYRWKGKDNQFTIPFKDQVSIRMAIFSVLTSLVMGKDMDEIAIKTDRLAAINMRLEAKDGTDNCLLINDSYNADLTSFTQAMQFLSLQDEGRKKVLILSDFYQVGMNSDDLNKLLASLIDKHHLSKLILVGQDVHGISRFLQNPTKIHHFPSTDKLIEQLDFLDFANEVILLKGARKFRFEKVFVKLSKRYHNTVLEINLDAIVQNLLVYRSFIKPETRVMAVIKASGYGAGSIKLARHLEKNNVNYFSVAFVDEGIELRKGGVRNPIMVFNSDLSFLEEMIEYQLEPVIFSFEYLDYIIEHAPTGLGVHLKLDSGLNRLGFQEKDLEQLCIKLDRLKHIRILSIYSHFSASPNSLYDEFSLKQAEVFEQGYDKVCSILGYKPIKHLLNSAGVVKFPQYQFDMVRMGSGMHGIDTSNRISDALQVVHSLKAKINMIKEVAAGDSVGYERMGITDRVRKIAIVPIGYADGLVRMASNERYSVWINGQFAPIVGNVNMDMTMIDISKLENVEIGDEVEVFGPHASIQSLAKAGNTIFYEILTRISPRVKRIYTIS